jgi:hypothetical protein
MGRPLNKKYFANTNYQDFGTANTGGESIASVTAPAGTLATLVNGTYTIPAGSIGAPNITGGAKPVLTVTVTGATAYTVTVVSAGSGYTSAPTITFAGSVAGGTGSATPVATLTSGASARQNGIKCETQYGSGDAEITTGDVVKQQGARRYKVQTSQGTGFFKLVSTEAKSAGEMSIKATDSDGNTYFVAKLTARKVVLVPAANVHGGTTTIGSQFASGTTAKWTFGAAVVNTTVTIENQ